MSTSAPSLRSYKVLVIGGSRNIGYHAAIRLLESGATVTFLLRNPAIFAENSVINQYVGDGKARLVKGDATIRTDVQKAWHESAEGSSSGVDLCLFTVGFSGMPGFSLTKGILISPADLVTRALLTTISTMPSSSTKLITISSTGLTKESHKNLPMIFKPLYGWLLDAPHKDKCGAEAIISYLAGWNWDAEVDGPNEDILPKRWMDAEGVPAAGWLKDGVVVIRPALLTDGECKGDKSTGNERPYRAVETDLTGYTISRKDVAHFIVEGVIKNWDEKKGKIWAMAY